LDHSGDCNAYRQDTVRYSYANSDCDFVGYEYWCAVFYEYKSIDLHSSADVHACQGSSWTTNIHTETNLDPSCHLDEGTYLDAGNSWTNVDTASNLYTHTTGYENSGFAVCNTYGSY
jgi:hypothetical protein